MIVIKLATTRRKCQGSEGKICKGFLFYLKKILVIYILVAVASSAVSMFYVNTALNSMLKKGTVFNYILLFS